MNYYIKDDYYFDIDKNNQLRITGPENHLLLGMEFPHDASITIQTYDANEDNLEINLSVNKSEIKTNVPLVSDIRTLRHYIEGKKPKPTYGDLVKENIVDILPRSVETSENDKNTIIRFFNSYEEDGELKQYGCEIIVKKPCAVKIEDQQLIFSCKNNVVLTVRTITNIHTIEKLNTQVFANKQINQQNLDQEIAQIYEESRKQVEFLVRTKKTSSFEYGTIFPRDWIESADLGYGDLTQDAFDYMYEQSMKYISEKGEGWHEEVVGEFRVKMKGKSELVDRKMIDIEPHYLMGIPKLSRQFLMREENQKKLSLVARYVLDKAKTNQFIRFKKISEESGEYYDAGNWRDGKNAFAGQKPPVAPYDVNCVFYPVSLKLINEYHEYLGIEDTEEVQKQIEKWSMNKDKFRLYHPDGVIGYSLALHGKKNLPMPVSHLDEAYDLLYGTPTLEDVVSFAKKIVDPDYFYTPVGPILVASDSENFTTEQYHGKVIWPKQTAFAVAGLSRQYRYGIENSWPEAVIETIKEGIIRTSEATFKAVKELGAVPELYYYDSIAGKARFYTDQESAEGQMSLIQLWSSIGFRRIVLEYNSISVV